MNDQPITNGDNNGDGRDKRGRFATGNPGGPGNPGARYARQVRDRWDESLFKVVSADRLVVAIDACLRKAEAGDILALKLLAERIKGPPIAGDVVERLEQLEDASNERMP